jgi:hypothetical protein
MLAIKTRALHMLGMCSTTELHLQPLFCNWSRNWQGVDEVGEVVEHLPSKREALRSSLSATKQTNK